MSEMFQRVLSWRSKPLVALGVLLSLGVAIWLVLAPVERARAVGIEFGSVPPTVSINGSLVFNVQITIPPSEFIPIQSILVTFTGPTTFSVTFGASGNILVADPRVTSVQLAGSPFFANGYNGYGTAPLNGYGYNFGNIYGYGYGYQTGNTFQNVLNYTITVNPGLLAVGNYTIQAHINTGSLVQPQFNSVTAAFNVFDPGPTAPPVTSSPVVAPSVVAPPVVAPPVVVPPVVAPPVVAPVTAANVGAVATQAAQSATAGSSAVQQAAQTGNVTALAAAAQTITSAAAQAAAAAGAGNTGAVSAAGQALSALASGAAQISVSGSASGSAALSTAGQAISSLATSAAQSGNVTGAGQVLAAAITNAVQTGNTAAFGQAFTSAAATAAATGAGATTALGQTFSAAATNAAATGTGATTALGQTFSAAATNAAATGTSATTALGRTFSAAATNAATAGAGATSALGQTFSAAAANAATGGAGVINALGQTLAAGANAATAGGLGALNALGQTLSAATNSAAATGNTQNIAQTVLSAAYVAPTAIVFTLNGGRAELAELIADKFEEQAISSNLSAEQEAQKMAQQAQQRATFSIGAHIPAEIFVMEKRPSPGQYTTTGTWTKTGSPAPIQDILSKLSRSIPGAHLKVEDVAQKPANVPALQGLLVANYLTITPQNFTDADSVATHVTFFVEKSWIASEKVHPLSIRFNRFNAASGKWEEHLGKLFKEDATRLYYSIAPPPGFSLWAIAGAAEPPAVQILANNLKVTPSQVTEGQSVEVSLDATNSGSSSGTQTFVLRLNGLVEQSKAVTVAPGQTVPVRFTMLAGAGSYEVSVDRLIGQLAVQPAPKAEPTVSATNVDFGTADTSRTVTVNNPATGGSLTLRATTDQPWLSVAPATVSSRANSAQPFTVSVDRAGLRPGNYTGRVTITYSGDLSGTLTVNFTASVPARVVASPTLSAASVSFGAADSSAQVRVVNPANGGAIQLTASADQPWIRVSPASGNLGAGQQLTMSVIVDRSGLQPGNYSGTVSIRYSGDATGTLTVAVTASVPQPAVQPAPQPAQPSAPAQPAAGKGVPVWLWVLIAVFAAVIVGGGALVLMRRKPAA